MLNPRLPILAGGIALLAIVCTQAFGWSEGAGFLFGWLLLATILIARRSVPFARRAGQAAGRMLVSLQWMVAARTRYDGASLTEHAERDTPSAAQVLSGTP